MRTTGLIAAAVLILSPLFIPIIALLAWVLTVAITWIRRSGCQHPSIAQRQPAVSR
jgi:hypothetical protein